MKRIPFFLTFLFILITSTSQAQSILDGEEIPWPLVSQHVVTAANSQGLWSINHLSEMRLFNVEIARTFTGEDWIRVSELHPLTMEVLSWGAAVFYNPAPISFLVGSPAPTFSQAADNADDFDSVGRFIDLMPNVGVDGDTFTVRLVEVDSWNGRKLGLSIVNYLDGTTEHELGLRMRSYPMSCGDSVQRNGSLTCTLF